MDAAALVSWVYTGILLFMVMHGFHRLFLAAVALGARRPVAAEPPMVWPKVTVQLPIYNERDVVLRCLRSIASLEYPRELLEIQVLDDSTDDTADLVIQEVRRLSERGVHIVRIHRSDRVGFKAGALQQGLQWASGELIAIFDADFVPSSDFLLQVVPHVRPETGMVQTRWGHLNADSWLTRAQSVALDAHFSVEHVARQRLGQFFNFNGTAGIWRRSAIEAAGGWSSATLTEDLDLSYRAQLAGWKFLYLDHVVTPGELPSDMASFKSQQFRWAKGAIQCAWRLLPKVIASSLPWKIKLEALFHLTANLGYPVSLGLALLLPVVLVLRMMGDRGGSSWWDVGCLSLTVASMLAYHLVALIRVGRPVWRRLLDLPIAMAMGLGLAVSQTRAVIEGCSGDVGEFVRTPKRGSANRSSYPTGRTQGSWLELALGLVISAVSVFAVADGAFRIIPFVTLFSVGYVMVGWASWPNGAKPARSGSR